MNLFFDTSVLVAAFVSAHANNGSALSAMRQVQEKGNQGWMSQHGIAEVYSVLTTLPVKPRIHAAQAWRILEENILPYCRPIGLDPKDYLQIAQKMAAEDWRGGRIYDALHLRCAQKAAADWIYTFNVKHFQQLSTAPEWAAKVRAPQP